MNDHIALIQVTLIAAVVGMLIAFVRIQDGVRMKASKRLAFVAFLMLNVYAVLFPEHVTAVAKLFGVQRGADLLLYLLIVAFTFTVLHFYLRLRESEQRVTELARAVAVRDAEVLNRERGLLPPVEALVPTVAGATSAGHTALETGAAQG
jgi:hypothetical protein